MSNSGYTCIRTVFCLVNILFWLTGCTLLGVGIWLRIVYEGYASLLPQYEFLSADTLAILIGAVTFILSFFACCGSWFQNRCMLITYFTLIVLMFVAEFTVGSLAFVYKESIKHRFREELETSLRHHYNMTYQMPNNLVMIWDNIQTNLGCCGVKSYEDWYMIDAWPDSKWVPDTCCLPASYDTDCGKSNDADNFYSRGCFDQIHVLLFIERLHLVGIVALMVAFVQLFGLISSMLLFCTVKHRRRTRTYKSYSS